MYGASWLLQGCQGWSYAATTLGWSYAATASVLCRVSTSQRGCAGWEKGLLGNSPGLNAAVSTLQGSKSRAGLLVAPEPAK